jgi:hypothetical protein
MALKAVITDLLKLYVQQLKSKERLETLGDLAALKQSLNILS